MFAAPRIVLGLQLLLAFCHTSDAILTLSSIVYGLVMSDLNFVNQECGVGRFREPHTAFTMAMTDGYSEYIYVSFPTDKIAKIEGDLPYALYSVFTTYSDHAQQVEEYGSLLDSDIVLDGEHPNPYVDGNLIDSEHRSYTIYAGPSKPDYATNWLSTDTGAKEEISIFILRVVGEYGDLQGRSSGEWVPRVSIFDEQGNQTKCDLFKDQGKLPVLADTYLTPVATPDSCDLLVLFDADIFPDFSFYPLPRTSHAFSNTVDGSYLTAELDYIPNNPDMNTFVIEFKNPPRVFSPGVDGPFFDSDAYDARYTSLCLYANFASAPRGIKCVTGMDLYDMYLEHGVAYVVGGNDASLKEHFGEKGIPFLQFEGSDFGSEVLGRYPFFIYRVQFPNNPTYNIDAQIPRWDQDCSDTKVTDGYYKADNEDNWGDIAPVGRQCSSENLVSNGCAFEGLEKMLKRSNVEKVFRENNLRHGPHD